MKVRACADALLRWSVGRIGVPGRHSNLPIRLVRPPTPNIPDLFPLGNVSSLVKMLRYPLEVEYGTTVHQLWRAYEVCLADVKNGSKEDIPKLFSRLTDLPLKVSEYLFSSDQESPERQVAEVSLLVAEIAHHIYGAKRVLGGENHAVKTGSEPSFGIMGNQVVSKFTKGFGASLAEYADVLRTRRRGAIPLNHPRILNAYYAAEEVGDEAVIYILDSSVWAANLGILDVTQESINLALAASALGESGRVRARDRMDREPLSDEIYAQCAYVLENAENPKKALKDMLVPVVISAADFMAQFTNPYTEAAPTRKLKEKLKQALDNLYQRDKT